MSKRKIGLQAALVCLAASLLHAQAPERPVTEKTRTVAITVVDTLNRYVSGLAREQFEVFENGTLVEVDGFQSSETGAAVAIVGMPAPADLKSILSGQSELIEAPSAAEAIDKLRASNRRKRAIVLTRTEGAVPAVRGIQVMRVDPASLQRAVVELRNQYLLRFETSDPAAKIEVKFQQSSLLPVLKHSWTAPF